jgi:hypothetical protein
MTHQRGTRRDNRQGSHRWQKRRCNSSATEHEMTPQRSHQACREACLRSQAHVTRAETPHESEASQNPAQ